MLRARCNERGAALLLSIVVLVAILGISAAYFTLVVGESKAQHSQSSATSAGYVAEAGLTQAMMELRTGQDLDGNGAVGATAGAFNGSPYSVTVTDMGDGTWQLLSTATVDGSTRAIEARVLVSLPLPAPGMNAQAALAILGQVGKKGKVDLHLKKPSSVGGNDDVVEPSEDEMWTSESTSPIAVDGHDAAGVKPDLPGLGIEDGTTYTAITQKIADQILKGKIPGDAFIGDPMNTIYDKKGNPATSSILPLQTNPASLNYENMNVIQDEIVNYVDTVLVPNANITITANNTKIKSDTTWGGPTDPKIVLLDSNKVEVQTDVKVEGWGTLLVLGDLSLLNKSIFTWHGDVIIMGGKNNDAKFQNHHATLTIDGSVMVLGTDSKKKTSKLVLDNAEKVNDSWTTINGPLLVWTSNNTDKAEKAEFKVKHGRVEINGFIGVYGDKTKLDVKIDDKKNQEDGGFIMNGGIVVAVPGSDAKHKVKIHLHGDDIGIFYNSVEVDKAVAYLTSFAQNLSTTNLQPTYQIVSWRAVVPTGPVSLPTSAGTTAYQP